MTPEIEEIVKKKYPYPISSAYMEVLGSENISSKIDRILELSEIISRFLAFVSLAEMIKNINNSNIAPPKSMISDFKLKMKRPSFGNWIEFAREGFKWSLNNKVTITIKEFTGLFFDNRGNETKFLECFNKILQLRNGLRHGKVAPSSKGEFETIERVLTGFLKIILENLLFLENVTFGLIKTIEIEKKPRKEAVFFHRGKNLKGESFKINLEEKFNDYQETGCVILKYDDRGNYLNLFPFYIHEDTNVKAEDIFFYNGSSDERKFEYVGCRNGGSLTIDNKISKQESESDIFSDFDLLMGKKVPVKENNKYSSEIEEEFNLIFEIFSGKV